MRHYRHCPDFHCARLYLTLQYSVGCVDSWASVTLTTAKLYHSPPHCAVCTVRKNRRENKVALNVSYSRINILFETQIQISPIYKQFFFESSLLLQHSKNTKPKINVCSCNSTTLTVHCTVNTMCIVQCTG